MSGSVRQRGVASWELRVYSGIDPDTGKRHYRTATVVGNRSDADRGLPELVASVRSKLLDWLGFDGFRAVGSLVRRS